MIAQFIEIVFSLAMFINAALFIPQAIRLYQEKDSRELSASTFIGFLGIQLFIMLHGIIKHDSLLTYGMLLSLITNGSVCWLIIYYRIKNKGRSS